MNWRYTNIQHGPRLEIGVTPNEYCVLDLYYQTQASPRYSVDGWSENTYEQIGLALGISKGTVYKMVDRFVSAQLMEVNPANPKQKKTTEKWYLAAYEREPKVSLGNETRSISEQESFLRKQQYKEVIELKENKKVKSKAEPVFSKNFKPNPKPVRKAKSGLTTGEKVERYITLKMGKLILDDLVGTDYDVARLASEIGNVAEDEGKFFNPKYPASKKWLEDKVWAWIARIEKTDEEEAPMIESTSGLFEVKASAYDRVIGIYQKVTGRLTSESQRVYLTPIIREHITKPGISDEQLKTAFNHLRRAGEVFDNLDYTLKNISKLLTWAQQPAA